MTGPVVLNLGCGYQTSERCINIDWSIPVRLHGSRIGSWLAPKVLTGRRLEAYQSMRGDIRSRDLRKGIPFADGSVDAVYHSHLLEHLDREVVPGFLAEVRRVLRPGGVHRIVVPDLERQARAYVRTLDEAASGRLDPAAHEQSVQVMLEQLVRREAWGSSTQRGPRRVLENVVLGDARRRGETHQWMWDRVSLVHALTEAGFREPVQHAHDTSAIDDWSAYGLDVMPDGGEYKSDSIYVEALA